MRLACSATVDVEGDTKLLKRVFNELMIAVTYVLWGDTFLLCTDGDRHSMLVTTTDESYFTVLQSEVAYVDVSWNIHSGKVSYMHTTIRIRQCGRHSSTLEFLFFHICLIVVLYVQSYCK